MSKSLPLIDVHTVDVASPPGRAGDAVTTVLSNYAAGRAWRVIAAALGCSERRSEGQLNVLGSTVPGFRVVRSEPPLVLGLEGKHRFAAYALEFRVEPIDPDQSRVSAESHALFPGPLGTIYRTIVIGSRGHVIAVARILSLIKQTAEEALSGDAAS